MRGKFLLAVLAVGVVALNSTPVAPAQTQAGDSVTGSAEFIEGGPFARGSSFALDAHSGPSGENPNGTATVTRVLVGTFTGPVTCLNVTAHRATIGIFASGDAAVFFFVEDNDGVGQDTVGWGLLPSSSPPTVCPATSTGLPFFRFFPPRPIDSGNIQVTDAPPFPTSKDQCKKGGWQQFGFKNQGRCIAFVNHQARRACLAERATIGLPAFRAKYGRGPRHRDALQSCIRLTVRG